MAVTSTRADEAIRADVTDLDLDAGILTVRGTKFGKTRLLLLHASVVDELGGYPALRSAAALPGTPAMLVSVAGTRLTYDNAHRVFKKLTAQAGIMPRSTACRPAGLTGRSNGLSVRAHGPALPQSSWIQLDYWGTRKCP